MAGAAKGMSKSERVYQVLRERILEGRYGAGYRLVLDKLATELGVSTVPVREAVRRLEAEGLVSFTRNVGAEVMGVNEREYTDAMQTLAYLEGAATSLAAPHVSDAALAEAEALNNEMRVLAEGPPNPLRFTELNEQFHRVLTAPCPNRHLLDLVHREWQRMAMVRRTSFASIPSRPAASVAEHDAIVELVRRGADLDEVEKSARNHKLRTMYQFLQSHDDADDVAALRS